MFCLSYQACNLAIHDILKGEAALMLEDMVLPGLGESGKRKSRYFDCIIRPELLLVVLLAGDRGGPAGGGLCAGCALHHVTFAVCAAVRPSGPAGYGLYGWPFIGSTDRQVSADLFPPKEIQNGFYCVLY